MDLTLAIMKVYELTKKRYPQIFLAMPFDKQHGV